MTADAATHGLFARIASSAAYGIVGGLLGRAVGLVGTLLVARHLTPDIVAEVPGLVARIAAAPLLFDPSSRVDDRRAPLPSAPRGVLQARPGRRR